MSQNLSTIKGGLYGTTIWVMKGDTRSLNRSTHGGGVWGL